MQLVELQEDAAGDPDLAVVAISYDPVDVLADFAERHSITYPLLSDAGSVVMGTLGVLNTELERDQAYWEKPYAERHHGLPFPGVFVLDADGVVESKHFERSHRNRPAIDVLIQRPNAGPGEVTAEEAASGVRITAGVAHRRFFPNQVSKIRLRLDIAAGLHVYVPPIDEGYRPLQVSVEAPDGFYWEAPELPSGVPYRVEGLPERFQVVEGRVDLEIPFHVHEEVGDVTPVVVVSYQTCTDTLCNPPVAVRLPLPLVARPKM